MRKRIACLFVAFCLLLLPLPWILAAPPARGLVFSWLETRLAGEIAADSCSFGWFSGLRCRNFTYRRQGMSVTATGELAGDKGLFMFMLAPGSLGEITLDRAVITLRTGRRPAPAASAANPSQPGGKTAERDQALRWWNNNAFRLLARRALVRLEHGDRMTDLLNDASGEAFLENGSLRYRLAGRAGGSAENLRAEGYVNAPPVGGGNAALLGTGVVILAEGPVAALPPLPFLPANALAGVEGRCGGSCRFRRDAEGVFRIEGSLTGANLALPALAAGGAPVNLGRTVLVFDVQTQGRDHLRVDRLGLESGAVNLNLRGILRPEQNGGESEFEGSASLALSPVAEALRGPLRLHDDARIAGGELRCDMRAHGPAGRLPLRLDCGIAAIEAMRGEKNIHWQAPLAFNLSGRFENTGFAPERAEAAGRFARFEAGPDENGGFACRAEADLGALLGEAGKLAALPWMSGGKLGFSLAREPEANIRKTAFDCAVDGFFLNMDGSELLPRHQLKLTGAAVERGGEMRAAELRGSTWPGSFALDIPAMRESDAGMQADYRLTADLQPARALPLVRRFWPAANEARLRMSGSARLDLAARLRDGRGAFPALLWDARHEIARARLDLTRPDFKWRTGDVDCAFGARAASLSAGAAAKAETTADGAGPRPPAALEPLRLESRIDDGRAAVSFVAPARRELALAPLALRSDVATLTGDLAFAGREKTSYALRLGGDLDGGLLESLLRSLGRMPTGARLRGPARVNVAARATGKTPAKTEIAAVLDRLVFGPAKKTLWEQRNLNLYARFTAMADASSSSWDLPEFSAQSPTFWARGTGFLLNQDRGGALLALDGRYRRGADPEQAGEPAPFQISVPLQ